jgi:predicted transposase YdaD
MAKPFEATLKDLVEGYPRNWLDHLGFSPTGPVELIDADLSTVTAGADKLLRVEDPEPLLLHLELQAGYEVDLDRRVLKYNVLAYDRHRLPVDSILVLLRREADGPHVTGQVQYQSARRRSSLTFSYDLIRIWQQPVDSILSGGLGTLPLAPLADVPRAQLPRVIRRLDERLTNEASPAEAAKLWTSTYILMGLRYPPDRVSQLLQGVQAMRESSTYQAILEEGRAEEARRLLLLQGHDRFGPPSSETRAAIETISSVERLEQLARRLLRASTWEELLTSS